MDHRITNAASAVESTADALVSVLDAANPTISPAQLRVLTIIETNRHTTIGRLAETLDVVPSSASRLCDRLEATGLVRRAADPRDRREVRLLLTSAARRLLDQLRDRRRWALAEVLDRMPEQSRQELVRALRAFAEVAGADQDEADGELRTA